MVHSKDLDIKH